MVLDIYHKITRVEEKCVKIKRGNWSAAPFDLYIYIEVVKFSF